MVRTWARFTKFGVAWLNLPPPPPNMVRVKGHFLGVGKTLIRFLESRSEITELGKANLQIYESGLKVI